MEADTAKRIEEMAAMLRRHGLRHHVDVELQAIRVVCVTETYRNLRDERIAIVTLSAPEEGRLLRGTIERAFAAGDDASRVCERLCRMAADTPLVGVEYDADLDNLRLVIETFLADARPTPQQVLTMIGCLVDAAEIWFAAGLLATDGRRGGHKADAA